LESGSTVATATGSQLIVGEKTRHSTTLSMDSVEKTATTNTSLSSASDDEEKKEQQHERGGGTSPASSALPTFTNEVIVIRPEVFYENTDC
jgi:hypothetical protein